MFRLIGGILGFVVICICLARQSVAGETDVRSLAVGWQLERGVETPSYAVTEPASTNLNIDSVVLSCEQGSSRRVVQLRLYLLGSGSLAPLGAGNDLGDDPAVGLIVDSVSHAAQLLFADDFVVVADSADGAVPLLSEALLDVLQAGRLMELRFQFAKVAHTNAPAFDGIAVVDLQAGSGGAAVAGVRRCALQGDGTQVQSDGAIRPFTLAVQDQSPSRQQE
jgi:hypothetical protein